MRDEPDLPAGAAPRPAPPPSAVRAEVGAAGALACGLVLTACVLLDVPIWVAVLALLFLTAAPMIALELHRRGAGFAWRPAGDLDVILGLRRLGVLAGLAAAAAAANAAVFLLHAPAWRGTMLSAFALTALLLLPFALARLPALFFRGGAGGDSALDRLPGLVRARLAGRAGAAERAELAEHGRRLLLKAFFVPLLIAHLLLQLNYSAQLVASPGLAPWKIFMFVHSVLYTVDLVFGIIGYVWTARQTGSQIDSTNPYLGAWLVCLVCYAPFVQLTLMPLAAHAGGPLWHAILADRPVLLAAAGAALVACELVYAWATVIYGLRFSNLTHRGIVTNGPYRYFKHPAYLAKNVSWWIFLLPFVPARGAGTAVLACLSLAGLNLVYWLRARTEERHLRADPAYRRYEAWIAEHGLLARARRLVAPGRPAARPAPAPFT